MGVKLAVGPGFAKPASSVAGMDTDKMRRRSASKADWKKKQEDCKKQTSECAVCKKKVSAGAQLTVEHMFPADRIWNITKNKQTVNQIRGHFTNPKNLMLMCKSCNSSKGGKTYRQWAADNPNLLTQQQASQFQAQANAFQDMLVKL